MTSDKKFGMLRSLLKAIGLSEQTADDAVNFIVDLLVGDSKDADAKALAAQFPYHLRDNFLSAAELHFYNSLRDAVAGRAVLISKVSLGDLFYVKRDDASRYRIYTNKIDRKHVDFLLCDMKTMQPLVGVELDDKSHQRPDRQTRDAFVDNVFKAAKLPLLHFPARRDYVVAEIATQLTPYLGGGVPAKVVQPLAAKSAAVPTQAAPKPAAIAETSPRCPKCGSEMVLRTAKTGANAGNKFWGCSGYPNCKSMVQY